MTEHPIRTTVRERFGGVIRQGSHVPDGKACALEATAIAKGLNWTDDPEVVGLPDIRMLNDAYWLTHTARTEALLPVIEAYWNWDMWSETRRYTVLERIVVATVREIIAELPGLPNEIREQCRAVETKQEAYYVALLAKDVLAHGHRLAAGDASIAAVVAAREKHSAYVATAISRAAARAADAAGRTDSETVLNKACRIWVEAAR